ncbi:tetratricopeptide repeat protein [Sulfurimonas sp.]|uniref:tetratricopeptide repeat protein n=1 Tax=Sulfurimonas sp. TaxID=2022749 RepID=UPI0025FCFD78|nr:tetratricopeptide repeat protein [Sulfurimonas sp.]MBT5935414.1 tetratricopeptide repeat protein [Sulfurimonas sp.]
MNKSKNLLLLSLVFPVIILSAEPSAFGAGNIDSSNPYGLTSNEKVILATKNKLNKVSIKSSNQANRLDSLRDRIDGLQSVLESLSRKAHNNKIHLKDQDVKNNLTRTNVKEYEKRLSEFVERNTKNIQEQKILLSQMVSLVDEISREYVSKKEFNALVNDVNKFKSLIVKELKTKTKTSSKSKLSSLSSIEVYNQADKYYKKKYYTDAIKNYEYLIKKNYKPAFAHYMIGEMNFKRKNYANAISYFKKSSAMYAEASYMPNLMLHTALAMKRTGDNNHAQAFFEAIIVKYPNSVESDKASLYIQP